MAGYFKVARGWRDNDIFKGEFSRADAWLWLIEHACWKPTKVRIKGQTVTIERGQLSFSQRFMADAWGWTKSRVDRFFAELRAESMIETCSKIGATAGHNAGQGQSIITIVNYSKYQDAESDQRGSDEIEIGATAGQQRGKEEEGKKERIEENNLPPSGEVANARDARGTEFAFSGQTIRLNAADLKRWTEAYHAIPDIIGELRALDDWLQSPDVAESKRKRWFHSVSGNLNRKHQQAMAEAARREAEAEEMPIV